MQRKLETMLAARPNSSFIGLVNRALQHVRGRARNDEGVAAIEFVLIFPILLILMLGSIEMFLMSMASRKMTRVASTVGDLVTQAKGTLTKEDIKGYYKVAKHIMGNFPEENLALKIYTFTKEEKTAPPTMAWNIKLGSYDCKEQVPQLSEDQKEAMQDGNDLVITYACYKYKVRIGSLVFGNLETFMRDEISLRPRQRMKLSCDDCDREQDDTTTNSATGNS